MTDMLRWLADHVEHAQVNAPSLDGTYVLVTRRPDGAYAPTSGRLSPEESVSLRAEVGVPAGWILETLYYDLGPTDQELVGYRAVIHGTRVLARRVVPQTSSKPIQIYTLNGGELVSPPGGIVPLYACLTMVIPDGTQAVVVGAPGPDSRLWQNGRRPFLQYILVTLSIRVHYEGSKVFAERRWHPDFIRTFESIGGVEGTKDAREVNRARQDFALMDNLANLRPKGGRPKGSKKADPGFADRYHQALRARYIAGFTDRPRQHEVAAEMGESVATLQRRVADQIVSWPPPWPPE